MADNQATQRPQSAANAQQATTGNATSGTAGGSIATDTRSSVRGTSSLERRTQLATPRGRTEIAPTPHRKLHKEMVAKCPGVYRVVP